MSRHNEIARVVRCTLMTSAVVAASVTGLPALAQDQTTANAPEQVESITITGSRIRRVDQETADPVFVVDSSTIQASGATNVGDIIQRIPEIAGAATNPQVNNGGGFAESNISLRGLGGYGTNTEPRTLILIDGRRLGLLGASNAVDVNAIPANLIERVEVLKEGAGAVYGSDAVAGVVNFITRKDFDGAEASLQYNETSRHDGKGRVASAILGSHTDKFSFTFGGSYTDQDGVSAAGRDFSKNSLGLYTGQAIIGGSSRTQFGRFNLNSTALPDASQTQENLLKTQFGCSAVTLLPGTTGTSLSNYRCRNVAAHPEDNFNFQPYNLLLVPQERTAMFTNLNYTFNDYVEAYAQVIFNRTRSGFTIAPLPFDTGADGVTISKNSMYNPFGIDFGGLPYSCVQKGVATTCSNPNATTRTTALGNRFSESVGDEKVAYSGLKGKLPGMDWDWNLGFEYGRLDQTADINGYIFLPLAKQAFGPSKLINGVPTCVDAAGNAISGCTPVNFFDINDPAQAAVLKTITAGYSTDNTYVTRAATLDFTGKVIDLPAGPLMSAVGLDYRWQHGAFTRSYDSIAVPPDYLTCQLSAETCGGQFSGAYSQKEIYLETLVPVLKDLPGVKALNLTGGVRYSDYSTFGNTTKGQIKVEYRPVNDVLVRGTFAQIFRAPTILDLYSPPANNAATFADPCTGLTAATIAGNPNYAKLCQYVPTDGTFAPANSQVTGLVSGNAKLKPETGNVVTYGVVYDSSFIAGLSADVDVWRYELNDVVSAIDPNFAATQCLTTGSPTYCGLFGRTPGSGQILAIQQPTFNLGKLKTEGVDMGVKYVMKTASLGSWRFAIDATWLKDFENAAAPGAPMTNIVGQFDRQFGNFAKWRAFAQVGWTYHAFDALLVGRYINRVDLLNPDAGDPTAKGYFAGPLKVPSVTYVDMTLGYNFVSNTRVQFGVTNLGDKQPPLLYSNNVTNANTDVQTYDTLGRRYFLTLTQKF